MTSRHHRTPRTRYPDRITPRAAGTPDHYNRLAHRITSRDLWLLHMLHEHKVLTSTQITALAWGTRRAANYRLRQLYLWRVLDRFQPHIDVGDAPAHYTLGPAGATILAASAGLTPKQLGYAHAREAARAHSLHLAHAIAVNEIFTNVVWRTRATTGAGHLSTWWGEARCARIWGDHIRPDAYARWRTPHGTTFEFFLERDLSTETITRVTRKLHGYAALAQATGITTPVLFWFETPAREANARDAFHDYLHASNSAETTPIATTVTTLPATSPGHPPLASDPRWLPLVQHQPLVRLDLDGLAHRWPAPTDSSTTGADSSPTGHAPSPTPPGRNR